MPVEDPGMALRLDEPTRTRLRRALLKKGQAIANDLATVLAGKGKKINLRELPVFAARPGMRPEERLRAYLDHVEKCRKLIDADDDRYGRCELCGTDLGLPALEQMPWADRCQPCASVLSAPPS